MAANLSNLVPVFHEKVVAALADLKSQGLMFVPYFTLRDPVTQARLWRQSRPRTAIDQQMADLRTQNCNFIADCLEKAGPSDGPWATNALPGLSWHQYGEAVDCFLCGASGTPVWESPSYGRFGQLGDKHGMWWGGHFGDNDHWQNRKFQPDSVFGTLKNINDQLAAKWNNLL